MHTTLTMKISSAALSLGLFALTASARYVFYYDQYHLTGLPNKTVTAGMDHVITAFANSSLFTTSPPGVYTPFEDLSTVRSRFDDGTKVLIAIGGWADTAGFSEGAATEETRALYASNVASMLDDHGFDGVDVDWEYPGGNGADYRQNPNSGKVSEIDTYPLLLAAIRSAIGTDKLLTIAVPAKVGDMIAYTAEKAPQIWESVDFVNIMTYDIMNRRDTITKHHTDVNASLAAVGYYLDTLCLPAEKANLGFAMYAKYFTVDSSVPCETGLGCATVLLEAADGSDTRMSAAMTFEASNYATAPTNMTESTDGACGATTFTFCPTGNCCSAFGFCGATAAHCTGCQPEYGDGCNSTSITTLFQTAMANGVTDEEAGGEYHYDVASSLFWTWDTPALIARKFRDIVAARRLGGVMAWSLGEDGYDFSHMLALQKGVSEMELTKCEPYRCDA